MAKDYNEIMLRELEKAGTGAKMTKVPESRRASPESLLKLERDIAENVFYPTKVTRKLIS